MKKPKYKLIESVADLQQLAARESGVDCFILLAGGGLRSSKEIFFSKRLFHIYNGIDGSEQKLTAEQLYTDSNIGQAIDKKALYQDL